ncbi:MAG: ribonuclease HII [Ignavibacteriales bacterium]|nr:MAG: ribonuclease HII [Ignavibacteriales bacterium]
MKSFDDSYRTNGIKLIAGVDEAGRGPLAGPVVAASVIFHPDDFIEGVNDSKQLNESERDNLFDIIKSKALAFSVSEISHSEIDEINILQASLKAMKQSVNKMNIKPDIVLIDGNKIFNSEMKTRAIVKGDSKSFSIAAASILAKVTRDGIMHMLDEEYPEYNWKKNKGYPTQFHISTIKRIGVSPYHRKTFLKKILPESKILQLDFSQVQQ